MIVIPAIDLRGGKAVRLLQGRSDAQTVYSSDPVQVARDFHAKGAQRIHIVDLDGAFEGRAVHLELIRQIVAEGIPVEVGGGVRDAATLQSLLAAGVQYVILGTAAVKDPAFLDAALALDRNRIIVGIDARDGQVRLEGWVEKSAFSPEELARHVRDKGVGRIIYTNIATDGMLTGPDIVGLTKLASLGGLAITASGGIGQLADLERVRELEPLGVDSCIVGKAIYEGKIDLVQALEAMG